VMVAGVGDAYSGYRDLAVCEEGLRGFCG